MGWLFGNNKSTLEKEEPTKVKRRKPIKPGRNGRKSDEYVYTNIPELIFISDITSQPSIFPFEEKKVWFVSNDGSLGISNMGNDKEIEIQAQYVHSYGSNYIDKNYLYFIEEEEGFLVSIPRPPEPKELLPILEKLNKTEIISLCLHDEIYFGDPHKLINSVRKWRSDLAKEREKALDYGSAIEIWESLGEIKEAARVRKLQAEMGLNRSNVGAGGDDKLGKIKELKELLDSGAIDDDEFKQMKKEILGK